MNLGKANIKKATHKEEDEGQGQDMDPNPTPEKRGIESEAKKGLLTFY